VSAVFSSQSSAAYVGLYMAPLVPAVCVAVGSPAFQPTDVLSIIEWGLLFYPISLVLGSLVGLPIFFVMSSLRLVNWWAIVAGGYLVGALIAVIIGFLVGGFQLKAITIFGLEGAGASLIFWLFWRMGPTPDAQSARIWVRGFVSRR
jgi:hypothetical protein